MSFGLGKMGRSGSAGALTVKAEAPSAALYTPASLDMNFVQDNVEIIRTADSDDLRQVYNPAQVLADILPNGTDGYSLSFYYPYQVGPRHQGNRMFTL